MSIQSIHMWRLIIWCGHALNSHEQLTSIWGFLGQRHQVGSVEIVPWYPMRPCRLCHSHFLTVVSYAFLPILQGCWLFKARSLPKVACSQTKDLAVTAGKPHSQLSQWSPDQSPLLRVRTCIMASTTAEIFFKDSNPMEPHRPQWTFQDLCAADRGQKPPRLPGESQPAQDGRGEWPSIHFIIFSTTYFILFRTWWIYNSLMEVKCPVQWVLQKKNYRCSENESKEPLCGRPLKISSSKSCWGLWWAGCANATLTEKMEMGTNSCRQWSDVEHLVYLKISRTLSLIFDWFLSRHWTSKWGHLLLTLVPRKESIQSLREFWVPQDMTSTFIAITSITKVICISWFCHILSMCLQGMSNGCVGWTRQPTA